MHIRPEAPGDEAGISALITEAFRGRAYASSIEAEIMERLRAAGALTLSLVAVSDTGELIGQAAASPATIGGEAGWFGFGPVAVLPAHQKTGIGSALMNAALAKLRADGAKGAVLVGDPNYYRRFGFASFPGLTYPGVPDENTMGLSFSDTKPQGEAVFHAAFASG